MSTLWPAINIWEGTCIFGFNSTTLTPFNTLYLYWLGHYSSWIPLHRHILILRQTIQAPLPLEVSPPLCLVSHPCQLILPSLWISHHCHVCIPVVSVCSELSTAFSLPRQILYILSSVAHRSKSFGYRLLADSVVRVSIHVHWRRLSSGFSCKKYWLPYSVVLPLPCDVSKVFNSLTFTQRSVYTNVYTNTKRHSSHSARSLQIDLTLPLFTADWIEPATFRFVAQYLNHYATAVPMKEM